MQTQITEPSLLDEMRARSAAYAHLEATIDRFIEQDRERRQATTS